MRVLILGGYGVFGGRLIELIANLNELEILACGRSRIKAEAFCQSIDSRAMLIPTELDRADIAEALSNLKPDLVVDASGPFQDYVAEPYRVVEACIEYKTHYLDFADAADFVFGISRFDEAAQKAGITILSGVSSFPVLTAAVLRELGKDIDVHSVVGGIAPSPYAGIGLNVMRAVVGYAGGPVKLTRGGKHIIARGLTESMRYTIAPPGFLPLKNIHFSLVDVPDLQVLPSENPSIKDIWMGAGPVPEFLHRALNILAKMRGNLGLPSFSFFAPLFYKILNLMKYGDHRGGMFIEAVGERDGKSITRSWHLLAEGDDGPYIPSMAIEAIIRKWLSGEIPAAGARAATKALELSDYDDLFKKRTIYWGIREMVNDSNPVFQKVIGTAFDNLPDKLREFHGATADRIWTGKAETIAATNLLAKLVALIFGFPRSNNSDTSVSVSVSGNASSELWQRNFGGSNFRSFLKPGIGKNQHMMMERFGPFQFALALVWREEKLLFLPRRWSIFGIPMPKFLIPTGDSFEFEENGRFHFNVTIKAPIIGHIISYRGWLEPSE